MVYGESRADKNLSLSFSARASRRVNKKKKKFSSRMTPGSLEAQRHCISYFLSILNAFALVAAFRHAISSSRAQRAIQEVTLLRESLSVSRSSSSSSSGSFAPLRKYHEYHYKSFGAR